MIDPTVVAFIKTLEILMAFLVQIVIMKEVPNYLEIIGAILVALSVASIAIQDYMSLKNKK